MSSDMMVLRAGYSGSSLRFPVLPEKITVGYGSDNTKLRVYGVGEVVVLQDSDATSISFESFFPKRYFNGCAYRDVPDPKRAVNKILEMKNSRKPIRLTKTKGMRISMYVTIEDFEPYEIGGDPGTIYYRIKFKEYREVVMRQVKVNVATKIASVSQPTQRVDPTPPARTYEVKQYDCLWDIALRFYKSGNRYIDIYNANKSIIGKNPNLIYAGQVLTLP